MDVAPATETRPAAFSDFLLPIALTGIGAGVLESIPLVSLCFVLWVPLAGGLAIRLVLRPKSGSPALTLGSAQVIAAGATVGAIAAAMYGVATFVVTYLVMAAASAEAGIEAMYGENMARQAGLSALLWAAATLGFSVLGAIGAFASARIFHKNQLK